MKKVMTLILAIFWILAFSSIAYRAQAAGIADTKHNLRSSGSSPLAGTADEICVYCHTPHGGKKALENDTGPLWNRDYTPGTFQVYESRTLDTSPATTPTSVSKACLSCHDGTLGINAMINRPGPGTNQGTEGPGKAIGDGSYTPTNNLAKIGTDLKDDHPISIIYQDAKSYGTGGGLPIGTDSHAAGFRANEADGNKFVVKSGTVTLPLYGATQALAKVECASCHDPHEERTGGSANPNSVFFLRTLNTGSALCLTCHLK